MLSDGAHILKTHSGGTAAGLRSEPICVCGGRARKLQELLDSHRLVLVLDPAPSCPSLVPRLAKVVLLCASAGEETSLVNLAAALSRFPRPPAIGLVAELSSEDLAISALRSGIREYWRKFPTRSELLRFIESACDSGLPHPKPVQRETEVSRAVPEPILTRELRRQLEQLAPV